MFSSTLERSVATLAIVAGLLAAAVPASAQGGGADFSAKDSPQAYMVDVIWQGYANPADSNEVAVEGMTLAHEGFEIQALGTRGGGEVISADAY